MAGEAVAKTTEFALQSSNVDEKKNSVQKSKKAAQSPKNSKQKVGAFKKIVRFFKDLKSEFKKIVWPSKKKALNNTLVVLAVMLIVGIFIWLMDYIFLQIFQLIY